MANSPRDLMAQEIDEELRREQLLKLWDKYGTFILAAAVVALLGVGGFMWYRSQQAQANEEASTQFIVALGDFSAKRSDEALQRLEALVPNAPAGYATLARLRLAAANDASGNAIAASEVYERIAKDSTVDPILQDYARLQIAMLKFDTVTFPELRNQLSPLTNERSPWRFSARELMGIGAMKAGLPQEARNHFQQLASEPGVPPGIAERARMMIAMIDDKERAKGGPGAGAASSKPEPAEGKAGAPPGTAK